MPLHLPNLDDRTFDDLMQEALTLIPGYAPEWTNFNPSDPGITLLELFAYLTEMLLYRQNQVTIANRQAFLNLICGLTTSDQKRYPMPLDEPTLNAEIRSAIQQLRQVDRAVTRQDFEQLAYRASPHVARVNCIPRRNLLSENPLYPEDRPGHISVVIVPAAADVLLGTANLQPDQWPNYSDEASTARGASLPLNSDRGQWLYIGLKIPFTGVQFQLQTAGEGYRLTLEYWDSAVWKPLPNVDHTSNWTASGLIQFNPPNDWIQSTVNGIGNYWIRISTDSSPSTVAAIAQIVPRTSVLQTVAAYLDERRLLTTKVHVVEPRYFPIRVQITLMLKPDATEEEVRRRAIQTLQTYFHPLKGGGDRTGWPFGRDVYVSEIYQLLDQVDGVDYVQRSTSNEGEPVDEIVTVNPLDGDRRRLNQHNQLVALAIDASELVDAHIQPEDITILSPLRIASRNGES